MSTVAAVRLLAYARRRFAAQLRAAFQQPTSDRLHPLVYDGGGQNARCPCYCAYHTGVIYAYDGAFDRARA